MKGKKKRQLKNLQTVQVSFNQQSIERVVGDSSLEDLIVFFFFFFFYNGKVRGRTAATSAPVRGSAAECGVSVPLFSDSETCRRQMRTRTGCVGGSVSLRGVLVAPFYKPGRSEEPTWWFQIQRWGFCEWRHC